MKKIIGIVLFGVGAILLLSAMGQDSYETHAFLHNKSVETTPFWVLGLKFIAGATFSAAGYEILKKGGE